KYVLRPSYGNHHYGVFRAVWAVQGPAPVRAAKKSLGRQKKEQGNGGRSSPESSGHFSQLCAQEQDAADDFPGERRQAPRRGHLVRQLLRLAAPGWALAIGLQARHID